MTVIDAYKLSLYSDDSLYVKDCNAWVTPAIDLDMPAFIVYVEDTDDKTYTWHYFLYERKADGTWDRQPIAKDVYIIIRNKWVLNIFEW